MSALSSTDCFLAQVDLWLIEAETELVGSLSEYLQVSSNEETNSPFCSHTPGKAPLTPGQAAMRKLRALVGEACGKRQQRGIHLSQEQCKDLQGRLLNIIAKAPNPSIMECAADSLVLIFDVFHPNESHGLPADEAAERAEAKKDLFLELVNLLIRTMSLNAKTAGNIENVDRKAIVGSALFFSRLRAGMTGFGEDTGLCNVLQDFHNSIGKTFLHLLEEFNTKDPVLAIDIAQHFLLYLTSLNAEEEMDDDVREKLTITMTNSYTAPTLKAFSVWSTHASPLKDQIVHLTKVHHGRDMFFQVQTVEHIWWRQFRGFLWAVSLLAENAELSWLNSFDGCFDGLNAVLNKCDPKQQAPMPLYEQIEVGLVKDDAERAVCLVVAIATTLAKMFVDERFTESPCIPDLLVTLYEHLKYPTFNLNTWYTDFEQIHPENDNYTHAPRAISEALGELASSLESKLPMVPIFGPLIMESLQAKLAPPSPEDDSAESAQPPKKRIGHKKGVKKAKKKEVSVEAEVAKSPVPSWGDEYAALLVIKDLRDTFERLFKKNFDQLMTLFLKFMRREENQFSRHAALHSLEALIAVHCGKIRGRFWKELLVACCDVIANTDEAPISISLALRCVGTLFSAFIDDEEVECHRDPSIRKKLPAVLRETQLIDKYLLQLIERSPHVNLRVEALRACSEIYQFLEDECEPFVSAAVPVLMNVLSEFPKQLKEMSPRCQTELQAHRERRSSEEYLGLVGKDVYERHPQLVWMTNYLDVFSLYSICVETSTVITDSVKSPGTSEFALLLCKELCQLVPSMDRHLHEVNAIVEASKEEHLTAGDPQKTYASCSESQARIEDQLTRVVVAAWARLLNNLGKNFEPFLEPMMNYLVSVALIDCAPQITVDSDKEAMHRTGFETNQSRNGHFVEYKFVDQTIGTITVKLSQTKQQMKSRAVDILAEVLNNEFVRSHPRIKEYREQSTRVILESLQKNDDATDFGEATDIAYAISQATDEIASHVADLLMAVFDSLQGKEQGRLAEKKRLGDEFSADALEAAKLENAEETKEILDRLFVPILETLFRFPVDTSVAFSRGAQAIPNLWGALGVAFGSTHKGAISVGNDYSHLFQKVFEKHWREASDTLVQLRQANAALTPQEAAEMQLEEEPLDNILQSLYEATEAAAMNGFKPCLEALSSNSQNWMTFLGTEGLTEWGALLAGLSIEARCPSYEKLIPQYLTSFANIATVPPKSSVFAGSPQQTGHYYLGVCLDRLYEDETQGKIPTGSLANLCKKMWNFITTYLTKNTPSRLDEPKGKKLKNLLPQDGVINPQLRSVVESLLASASLEDDGASILEDRSELDKEVMDESESDGFDTDEDDEALEEDDDEKREFMSRGGVEINFLSTLLKLLEYCPQDGQPEHHAATMTRCHQAMWNFVPSGGWDISEAKIVHKKLLERVLLPQLKERERRKKTNTTGQQSPSTCLLDTPLEDPDLISLASGLLQVSPKFLSQATLKLIAEHWDLLSSAAEAGGPMRRQMYGMMAQMTMKAQKSKPSSSTTGGGSRSDGGGRGRGGGGGFGFRV